MPTQDLPPGMHPTQNAHPLPIARYRFTARMRQSVRLPDYPGSLLRGQFGATLRHLACMTRQPHCTACPLQASCPYTRIFESPPPPSHRLQAFNAIPNAYVIEPPLPPMGLTQLRRPPTGQPHPQDLGQDQNLVFHMVLIGEAIDQLALVVFAWQRALAQGLTKSRSPADLLQVDWLDENNQPHPIWSQETPVLASHPASLHAPAPPWAGAPESPTVALELQIQTPLRLQQQGQPLRPHQLSPRVLVANLARRVALVLEFHAQQPTWGDQVPPLIAQAQALGQRLDLTWFDWMRYSSRQQQEMTLGGVLGTWTLEGSTPVLETLWPWLWLGQWLHIGKNATMGMGGYRLQAPPSPTPQ